jgi:hypothetical protein
MAAATRLAEPQATETWGWKTAARVLTTAGAHKCLGECRQMCIQMSVSEHDQDEQKS